MLEVFPSYTPPHTLPVLTMEYNCLLDIVSELLLQVPKDASI